MFVPTTERLITKTIKMSTLHFRWFYFSFYFYGQMR